MSWTGRVASDRVLQVIDGGRSLVAAVGSRGAGWGACWEGTPFWERSWGVGGGEGPGRMMLGWMAGGCSELGEGAQHREEWRHWKLEPAEGQRT